MLKISQLTLALCATATLVACGGGGSGGGGGAATAFATSAYGGNWKDQCFVGESGFKNSANVHLNEQYFISLTPTSDTTVSNVETVKHFAPSDTTCSGTPVIVQTKATQVLTFVGTTTIGGQVVDKITFPGEAATTGLVSGSISLSGSTLNAGTVSINGYTLNGGYLSGDTNIGQQLLRATATAIYCGLDGTKPVQIRFLLPWIQRFA